MQILLERIPYKETVILKRTKAIIYLIFVKSVVPIMFVSEQHIISPRCDGELRQDGKLSYNGNTDTHDE